MVTEQEIISILTQIYPYLTGAGIGSAITIFFKVLNYQLKKKTDESKMKLEKQKMESLEAQKNKEIQLSRQLKKFETLLDGQKYYLQAASSAGGLKEHISKKSEDGIKSFFMLWVFMQRRKRILEDVGYYFFSQRIAEKAIHTLDYKIATKIRDKISSTGFTRLEQLKINDIQDLKEKCESDSDIKEIYKKFLEFMNEDLDSFKLHLELYVNIMTYIINDMFKDWYQDDKEFGGEQQELRSKINTELKTDDDLKKFLLE